MKFCVLLGEVMWNKRSQLLYKLSSLLQNTQDNEEIRETQNCKYSQGTRYNKVKGHSLQDQ